jgi:hypothetical protein
MDPLTRELDAAVRVEPSPEFVARIRMRVAQETPAADTRLRLAWGTWATVIATLVVAFTLSRSVAVPSPLVARHLDVGLAGAPIVTPEQVSALASSPRARVAALPRQVPDVVIAQDELAAIAALAQRVQHGQFVVVTDDSLRPFDYDAPLAMVTVPAITIEPLGRLTPIEGARQ